MDSLGECCKEGRGKGKGERERERDWENAFQAEHWEGELSNLTHLRLVVCLVGLSSNLSKSIFVTHSLYLTYVRGGVGKQTKNVLCLCTGTKQYL